MLWIQTFTDKVFDFEHTTPEMVCIEDIAHALSMLCRFTGHRSFYSVAEHCINVSRLLKDQGYDVNIQKFGLLHDASEAYLNDISSPLKKLLPDYRRIEKRIEDCIIDRFDLVNTYTMDNYAIVKKADLIMLATEHSQLFKKVPKSWNLTEKPAKIKIYGYSPPQVEKLFLKEAKILGVKLPPCKGCVKKA